MNKKNLINYLQKMQENCDDIIWKPNYATIIRRIKENKNSAIEFLKFKKREYYKSIEIFKNVPIIVYYYQNNIGIINRLIDIINLCEF